ncbi:hypothetical protein NCU08753 [Neurospora crassa OR74A]|uniref:DUF6604 domain-containing protein n=1 Tax=Neurospora crassa (strain ATCC 24698 / 74-OR23-1A / CBS 708.71 / DSM 1257 / FGSC 987) TaxID=367110 RepID=Q7RWP4_NEUCR|nr:hypothetical protein NCU08753 [Neurospora crassa OR74A]EAA26866.2 hypothetical protein NCU08753 [Neurospora crassa OR74A]|eukprot:XP_956102.2 hypothetical protein NCU08753 [Neurospora crassa OR74A]
MLPSNLISIYAESKRDTNAIASWLASSARICGYPTEKLSLGSWNSSPSTEAAKPTGRLKRKAREQAEQATSFTATSITPPKPYTLAVADFVPLAEFIVRSKRPAISVSPSVVSILNRAISARSNFGQLLGEQQDTILDPQSDATHQHFVEVLEKVRKILLSKMPPAIPTADEVNGAQHLSNQFGLLRIQQPSLNVVDADPSIPKTEKKNNHPAAVQEDKTEYIAEEPSSRSDAVATYCMLFQDITIIRGAVMDIWAGVRDGTTDYVAASIATDTAIGMIRDIADTVTSVMKPHGGILHIMRLFHIVRCRTRGIDMTAVRFEDREKLLHDTDEDAISGVGWDKDTKWLNLCVSECTMLAEGFEDDEGLYPVRDMFVQGVQETMNTKEVPFYAIIAGQLNLDIHHVLGKKTKDVAREALRELSEIRRDVSSILNCHGEDSYLEHQLKLLNLVLSDPVKQVKDWSLEPGLPVAKAHQTLELLPVLTGQLVHHYRVAIYQFAIRIATVTGSIQYATQLYHALRTESLVKAEWPDLDHARKLLGESSFYVGSLPKNIPEYMSKFSLQAGLSPAAKARQGRSKKRSKRQAREADRSQYTTEGPRMIADGDDRLPFSKKFIKLHESNWKKELEAWSRELLRDIIATVNIEPITLSKSEGNSRSSNSQEDKSNSRLRCVLLKLAETLHDESRSLCFPLLKVHQSSWELLTTARDRCGPMLRAYFREPDFEDDELTWFITGYIFSAACRAHDKNRIGLPLKQGPDLRPLKMAGEVCERLLTSRRDFGTRALRWMQGGGKSPQQDVDVVVGQQAIENTCLNGTGVKDKEPGVICHEITGSKHHSDKTGVEVQDLYKTSVGQTQVDTG